MIFLHTSVFPPHQPEPQKQTGLWWSPHAELKLPLEQVLGASAASLLDIYVVRDSRVLRERNPVRRRRQTCQLGPGTKPLIKQTLFKKERVIFNMRQGGGCHLNSSLSLSSSQGEIDKLVYLSWCHQIHKLGSCSQFQDIGKFKSLF